MTTFINKNKVKESAKTVFTRVINHDGTSSRNLILQPVEFDYVELIGIDSSYGAVFKAYDEGESDFALYFGIAGDEFNQ